MPYHQKYISLVLGSLMLLLTMGLPVYQVHCDCSGQTRVSVLVEPLTCADHHNHCCNTHEHDSSDADHHGTVCFTASHHCDRMDTRVVFFDELQESVAPSSIVVNKILPVIPALLPYLKVVTEMSALTDFNVSFGESPRLVVSPRDFLNIICQRKIPARA